VAEINKIENPRRADAAEVPPEPPNAPALLVRGARVRPVQGSSGRTPYVESLQRI